MCSWEQHKKNRQGLTSHRSTIYPCFDQDLGDSTGAGRISLARVQKYTFLVCCSNVSVLFFANQ